MCYNIFQHGQQWLAYTECWLDFDQVLTFIDKYWPSIDLRWLDFDKVFSLNVYHLQIKMLWLVHNNKYEPQSIISKEFHWPYISNIKTEIISQIINFPMFCYYIYFMYSNLR